MRAERLSEGGLGFGTRSGCDQTRDVWVQRESRFGDASHKEKLVNGQNAPSNPHFIVIR